MASAAISAELLVQLGADRAEGALDVVHNLLLGRLACAESVQPLHDFEFNILEVRAALVERGDVLLQGDEVLGQAGAAVEPGFVPFDPGATCSTSASARLSSGFGVMDGHFRGAQFAVGNAEGGFKVGDPGIALKAAAAVGQGFQLGVQSLQFEQLQLFRRCCLGHYLPPLDPIRPKPGTPAGLSRL